MAFGKSKRGNKSDKQFDDRNSGALFVNDKQGKESRPDRTGKLTIDPNDYEPNEEGLVVIQLAAWIKDSPRVGEYLSLKAQPQQKAE